MASVCLQIQKLVYQCCWSRLEHSGTVWAKTNGSPATDYLITRIWLGYTSTGLVVCIRREKREQGYKSQGLLTTVAAVLVPVEPHINQHVTLTFCLCTLACKCVHASLWIFGRYKRAKTLKWLLNLWVNGEERAEKRKHMDKRIKWFRAKWFWMNI